MKNLILLLLMQMTLIACGSPTPFQRGQPQEKPAPTETKPSTEEQGMTDVQYFENKVAPLIKQDCGACHGDRATYAKALALVVPGNTEQSPLYQKATGGTRHGGGTLWEPTSPEAAVVKTWIMNIGKTITTDSI